VSRGARAVSSSPGARGPASARASSAYALRASLVLIVSFALLCACDRRPAAPVSSPAASPASPAPSASTSPAATLPGDADAGASPASLLAAQPAAPRDFFGLEGGDADWIARAGRAQPARFRPIGTSSLVFKVYFSGGLEAAFRPRVRAQGRGWIHEVVAYRLARVLGMDQVPPVVSRGVARREVMAHLDADYGGDRGALEADLAARGDVVWGALVAWVPGLRDLALDTSRGIARSRPWLAQSGALPAGDEATLAADLSTMIAFDYLIANVDRWSGANVRADASGRRLVVRDHNLALLAPLPDAQHERLLGPLRRVERFSRRFTGALRALDEARVRASLAADPAFAEGVVDVDAGQIAGILERREALLSRVGALVDVYGDEAVLAFP
jgi:hypothetical protein